MKKTKHDYDKAFKSLINQLEPIIQKIEQIKDNKPTKENLQIENGLLYQALFQCQKHINILDILIGLPIGSGVKGSPENEAILLKALEEFIIENKKYPTEVEWMTWVNKPKYKPHQTAKTTDSINGWGHAKLKKYRIEHKTEEKRIKSYEKISDMFVVVAMKNINH